MAYVPDVSGFLKPLGGVTNLDEILDSEVPKQLELRYFKNDITEFDTDMYVVLRAEDGFRIRLIVNNKTASVISIRNPSHDFRNCYNKRGYLITSPVFVFENDVILLNVCDKLNKVCTYYLQRFVKIKGTSSPLFFIRIWSDSTPDYISPKKIELISL